MASSDGSAAIWAALGAAGAAGAAVAWGALRSQKALPFPAPEPSGPVDISMAPVAPSAGKAVPGAAGAAVSPLAAVLGHALKGEAAFVYDLVNDDAQGALAEARLAGEAFKSLTSGQEADVVTGLATGSTGAGAVVRGAMSGGLSRVSVIIDSSSAPAFLPSLEALARDGRRVVAHVAASGVQPDSLAERISPLTALRAAAQLHRSAHAGRVPIVTSGDDASEAQAGASLAASLAGATGGPAVHVFGSGSTAIVGGCVRPDAEAAPGASLEDLTPSFFSYTGHPEATDVAITLATGAAPLAGAVAMLASEGARVGLLRVRVLRPWSSRQLLKALPASARRLVVVLPTDDADDAAHAATAEPSRADPDDAKAGEGPVVGSPLRPGSTAAAVEDITRKRREGGAHGATASASALARRALGRGVALPSARSGEHSPPGGSGASVVSTASTFARAAAAATSRGPARAGAARRLAGTATVSSPTALFAALVDAAASARDAESAARGGRHVATSVVLVPAEGPTAGYLASAAGLRLAVRALADGAAAADRLWASLIDACDGLGLAAVTRTVAPIVPGGPEAAVRAAVLASTGGATSDARALGLLARTSVVVSDAGALQRTELVSSAAVLAVAATTGALLRPADLPDIASVVAVLGAAATVLVLPGALAAAAVLDCTAAPSAELLLGTSRPRAVLAVRLGHEDDAADAAGALLREAGEDVRAAAAATAAGPVVVVSDTDGVISGRNGAPLARSSLRGATLAHTDLAARAAEAEATVLEAQAEEAKEAEAKAGPPGLPFRGSGVWGASAMEDGKSSDGDGSYRQAPAHGAAATKLVGAAVSGPRPADALTGLAPVRLSREVLCALAGQAIRADGAGARDGASTVASERALGVVPPPAPVLVPASSLRVPRHVALPFMFPEAFRASSAPHPAEPESLYQATVARKVRLTPEDYSRNVFHIEFDIPEGVTYEMGEALGVFGHNDAAEVDDFLEWYGLNGSDVVTLPPVERVLAAGNQELPAGYGETTTVSRAFTQVVDLFGPVSKRFLEGFAAYATDAGERTQLFFLTCPEGKDAFKALVAETATVADVIHRFPSARPPVHDLLAIVPPIKPRHYSIASSQRMHPTQVHLLVVTVEWQDPQERRRMGHCTRYLDALRPGDTAVVSIKPSVMKLPRDHRAPVVMAGLGTGMAPFRAFIEERAVLKRQGVDVGPMMLYFGSRNRANEYLYGDELEAYEREGVLTRQRLAFSRDQRRKVYIQHLMNEDGKELASMLLEGGGSFYLCGPTWPEGPVQDAMEAAFATSGRDGGEVVQAMKEDERYILEVY